MAEDSKVNIFGGHSAFFGKAMNQNGDCLLTGFFVKTVQQAVIDVSKTHTQFMDAVTQSIRSGPGHFPSQRAKFQNTLVRLGSDARVTPLHLPEPFQIGNSLGFILKENDSCLRHKQLSLICDSYVNTIYLFHLFF